MDMSQHEKKIREKDIYRILLLTNRDSDNVGDQVIEACAISLVQAVMKNLNIEKKEYKISSRAAGIISKKYVATKDPALLNTAEEVIKNSDVIIFGGAPLFNFDHQIFYERTATTLELAEKYNIPVIFSSIGIEGYSDENAKCQRLKKTLNFPCVKQITTRDDFESLQKYVEDGHITIKKVADSAVWAGTILKNYITPRENREKKKIGIFVLRDSGFEDNGINFPFESAVEFWEKLAETLEEKGYDYEILSNGHFGDEAILDYLIRNRNISEQKCVFNMNCPERLIGRISSYDAVISCRLHPSIISYALKVPSLGILWNEKVRFFYDSVGYQDRMLTVDELDCDKIIEKLEQIVSEGVKQDNEYMVSVYEALFEALKRLIYANDCPLEPYSYQELTENIPIFQGTSQKEYEEKIKRKFRRTYERYNNNKIQLKNLKKRSVKKIIKERAKRKIRNLFK